MTQYSTAQTQPSLIVNEGNFIAGIHNITVDGQYVGAIKAGTGATMRMVPADLPIEAAQYPGEVLGMRQMGEHYEIDVELVEATRENYALLLDQKGYQISRLFALGKRNRVATKHFVVIYVDGPDGYQRRWSLFSVFFRPRGDFNIGSPTEFSNIPLTMVLTPDRNYPEASQFGQFEDYVA